MTQIHKLTAEQRKNIPGDNLNCERYLAKFGALAAVSASKSNKFFNAKRIRDDMLFSVNMTNEEDIKLSSEKIFKELNSMEFEWTERQKQCMKQKIELNLQKKRRSF